MNRPLILDRVSSEARYLSTAQAAAALGVSVTTVKRWVDEEILPAQRSAGGHRKVMSADVLRLVREGRLPEGDLSYIHSSEPSTLARRFAAAIRDDHLDLLRGIVCGGYKAGVAIETLADEVIAPALHQVGEDWAAGRMPVMREHRILQTCVSAVYELADFLRPAPSRQRTVAVGGAPEHDHSILGTLLAKLVLLDAGWDAINLGPHTPVEAIEEAIVQYSPRLIWLSVTHLTDPEQFLNDSRRLYHFAERRGVAIAVGGCGLTEPVRSRMRYTSFGDGLTQFAAFARTLNPRPRLPKRGRPRRANGEPATGGG